MFLGQQVYFVPEGQPDSSQARSAWDYEENSLVPAGRLNSWLTFMTSKIRSNIIGAELFHRST